MPELERYPHAVWSGSFTLFGVEVKCHTLSDGQRIIESDSVNQLLLGMHDEMPPPDSEQERQLLAFQRWRAGKDN